MARATLMWLTVVEMFMQAFAGGAYANPRWNCGDDTAYRVSIDESESDPSAGVLQLAIPNGGDTTGYLCVNLDCAMQGHGLGTEWICTAADDKLPDLTVEVRRGRRTNDPWALATVWLGEHKLADGLPCTVEHINNF